MHAILLAVSGCTTDNKVSVYNEPPIATLTAPVSGAALHAGDTVPLAGEVSDREDDPDGLPLTVTWLAGSEEICPGTVAEAGVVGCTWTATEGTSQLTLRARDSAGETSEDTIDVTVTPNGPPDITITSPVATGEYWTDLALTLEASVSDPESGAAELSVAWTSDVDGWLAEGAAASSGTAVATATLSAGPHALTATVTDPGGATDVAIVSVVVYGENTAPSCVFLSPPADTAVALGEVVMLEGTATDAETRPSALQVSLASQLETITGAVPVDDEGAFTWPWTPSLPGTHLVTMSGEDSRGETCTDTLVIEVCDDAWYADVDGDGHGDPGSGTVACEAPEGHVADDTDCDDGDASVYPGAAFEESLVDCMRDADGDGWGDTSVPAEVTAGADCDDGDAAVNPDAEEVCDGLDDDCDGTTDGATALGAETWYADADGDGYGDPSTTATDCDAPAGYVADDDDCDDTRALSNPAATEYCNGEDDDCDGTTDEDASVDADTWYADTDGDGHGDPAASAVACSAPGGHVADDTDCDDGDATVYPGAAFEESLVDCMQDADGDGWGDTSVPADVTAGTDCDDRDPAVNPDAEEVCDGVDNDCDGTTDGAAASDAATWYADADRDGYGDPSTTTSACDAPRGYVADDDDCDDTRAQSNPAATEYCNGEDDDCDGTTDEEAAVDADTWYADTDGDGYGDPAAPTDACVAPSNHVADDSDCDDGDPATYPAADDPCDDGIDQDCDGVDATCAARTVKYTGEAAGDYAGMAVSGAGDVDGDGYGDVLVGAAYNGDAGTIAGAAYLVLGGRAPASASLSTAVQFSGEAAYDYAGRSVVGVGDIDRDGYDDLLVGAYGQDGTGANAGAAYLVFGSRTPASASLATTVEYSGAAAGDYAGYSVGAAGDFDGDGYQDLLVGAIYSDAGASAAGAAFLVSGSGAPASANLSTAVEYRGEAASDWAGASVGGAGDVDGDGNDDLLVGAFGDDDAGSSAGAAYLVLGSSAPASASLASAVKYTGEAAGDNAGISVAGVGDVDRDGYGDFLVGATGNDDAGSSAGAAYLVLGSSAPASASLSSAVEYTGEAAGDIAGFDVAATDDVDGDGYVDFLVGAHYNDDGGSNAGAAYLVFGSNAPVSQSLSLAQEYTGEAPGDYAGYALDGAGDVDADGTPDLVVGATYNDEVGAEAGAAYLLLNP